MYECLVSCAMPSNYSGLALWQTALADSIYLVGYVAQMLKLLLGWGLPLKDALVDEIYDVVHYVFAHPSRCAVCRRQFRHGAASATD
jgi:hypothetical protein